MISLKCCQTNALFNVILSFFGYYCLMVIDRDISCLFHLREYRDLSLIKFVIGRSQVQLALHS